MSDAVCLKIGCFFQKWVCFIGVTYAMWILWAEEILLGQGVLYWYKILLAWPRFEDFWKKSNRSVKTTLIWLSIFLGWSSISNYIILLITLLRQPAKLSVYVMMSCSRIDILSWKVPKQCLLMKLEAKEEVSKGIVFSVLCVRGLSKEAWWSEFAVNNNK